MDWKEKAIKTLKDSLSPVPTELNELDWKSGLSCKTDRLAQHISAFANNKGGGVLVYGVNDDGSCFNLSREDIKTIVQKLGNIAKNNLEYSIPISHSVMKFNGYDLLFIYIPEQHDKPVVLRGHNIFDSYLRSAGQTVKMSRDQVKEMIATSKGVTFEERLALSDLTKGQILQYLDYKSFFELVGRDVPNTTDSIVNRLSEYNLCHGNNGIWGITNLGALLFARDLKDFPKLRGREVIVRKYSGKNNRSQEFEQHGTYGYAVGFEGLIDFIMQNTGKESIGVKREIIPTYPQIAIREFVANAIVHQDFGIKGLPVTIEIFSNRLAITNAGAPLNDINRLIDLPPQSRNEELAQTMFLLGICEKRGSGIDRAISAIEQMFLPAPKFTKGEQHTRIFLYPQKKFKDMIKDEKVSACYQHACLRYENGEYINNLSVRERFELTKNDSSIASRIIADTVEVGLIKPVDPETKSKKFMTYLPYYV